MRKQGIDLLRIISMLMIIGLHFFNYGGAIDYFHDLNVNFIITWSGEAFCYLGVNCFVLISGYFGVGKKVNINRICKLIVEMWFYSGFFLILGILFKGIVNVNMVMIIKALTPVVSGDYWFVTSYIVLMALSPILNIFVDHITRRQFGCSLLVMIVMFSLVPSFIPWCDINLSNNGGASPLWFIVLYLTGGYVKMNQIHINYKKGILGIICLLTIVISSKVVIYSITDRLIGKSLGSGIFYHHYSFPIYVSSLILFVIFLNLNTNNVVARLINFSTPAVLGVYLIHDNIFFKQLIWLYVKRAQNFQSHFWVFYVLICIFSIFIVCLLIEKARIFVFNSLNINRISDEMERLFHRCIEKLVRGSINTL